MRRIHVLLLLSSFLLVFAPPASAQNAATGASFGPSEEVLKSWNSIGHRLIEMAEDFPEDKYDFKPKPEVRTFAEQLLHAAGVNFMLINAVKGAPPPAGPDPENPSRQTYKTKADVVAFVKKSFDDGAALIKEKGDAGVSQIVKFPFNDWKVTANFAWNSAVSHSSEHYGQLVVYYRLNGLVPPASRPRK
jgi:hypothetical protein